MKPWTSTLILLAPPPLSKNRQVLSQPPNANELALKPVTSEIAEYVSSKARETLQPPVSHEHTRPTPKYH